MMNQSPGASLETWHRRLCHRSLDDAAVRYISSKVENMEGNNKRELTTKICGICAQGRQHNEAGTKRREKCREILAIVHSDLCGPMQTVGLNGERYFVILIDEMSGWVSIALLNTKDGALKAFESYRARAEKSSGKVIKVFRSDEGGEYLNREFTKYLTEAGIHHIMSPPYTPSQNGLEESTNRTIMEDARCILEDSQLGKEFWGYAVLNATHIHNRLPSRSHNNISPLQHWTGKIPEIGHLRIFGSTTWMHVPSERRQKLDPKSIRCVLVGYEEDAGSRVYSQYNPITKKVVVSRDVIIDESSAIGNAQDVSHITSTEWNKESPTTVLKPSNVEEEDFQPLDTIIPPVGPIEEIAGIQESITVRPRLAVQDITQGERNAIEEAGQQKASEPRWSQRMRQPSGLFNSHAQFISKKKVYSRRIGPASGRRASAPFLPYVLNVRLCVLCILNVLNVRAS